MKDFHIHYLLEHSQWTRLSTGEGIRGLKHLFPTVQAGLPWVSHVTLQSLINYNQKCQ